MPQAKRYRSRAEQQAAYRKRQVVAQHELLARKGLPPTKAIPTMPSRARWTAMVEQAQQFLTLAADEMQSYHDDRSEQWQESEMAEQMLSNIEVLTNAADQLFEIA